MFGITETIGRRVGLGLPLHRHTCTVAQLLAHTALVRNGMEWRVSIIISRRARSSLVALNSASHGRNIISHNLHDEANLAWAYTSVASIQGGNGGLENRTGVFCSHDSACVCGDTRPKIGLCKEGRQRQ